MLCPSNTGKHALPWGSAQFIGLGFSVWVTIIILERFGSPLMKSCAVVLGLVVGIIISVGAGYFDNTPINQAPAATFIWVKTFPLSVAGPIVLPFLAVFLILMMEAIGDITATCDVSRLEVEGREYDTRIQGGVLADGISKPYISNPGINGCLAGLCTITPMSTFAQNNGVISLTRCANRKAGYCCCFFLFIMGVFSKFAAVFVAIPSAVLGGMTTFLFTAVAVSGVRILATCEFSRRNRFIMTCALSMGFGAILVPNWFSFFFTYSGDNKALAGFLDAITLMMEAGYALAGVISLILNLMLPEESEKHEFVTTGQDDDDTATRNLEQGHTTGMDTGMMERKSISTGSDEHKGTPIGEMPIGATSKME
jgi:NCS2 family nucleobase:cation symporter-2